MNTLDIFLIVADFINGQRTGVFGDQQAGAGSLVAYALTITDWIPKV